MKFGRRLDAAQFGRQRFEIEHVSKTVLQFAAHEHFENFRVDSFEHHFVKMLVELDDVAQGRYDLFAAQHLAAFLEVYGHALDAFI